MRFFQTTSNAELVNFIFRGAFQWKAKSFLFFPGFCLQSIVKIKLIKSTECEVHSSETSIIHFNKLINRAFFNDIRMQFGEISLAKVKSKDFNEWTEWECDVWMTPSCVGGSWRRMKSRKLSGRELSWISRLHSRTRSRWSSSRAAISISSLAGD